MSQNISIFGVVLGEAANNAVSKLPSGSVLINHSPNDSSILTLYALDSIKNSLKKREERQNNNQNLFPVQEYVDDFNYNVLQTATINKIENKEITRHTTRNAKNFLTKIKEQKKYFKYEIKNIHKKFNISTPLNLTDQEIHKYMHDLISIESLTKRGLIKLNTKMPEDKITTLKEMILNTIVLDEEPLLQIASSSSLEIFKSLDINKSLALDNYLLTSLINNKKDIADYIINNDRLSNVDPNDFKKLSNPYINFFLDNIEKNNNYWQIAALLETGLDTSLNQYLHSMNLDSRNKLIECVTKNGYAVAMKTLIENSFEVLLGNTFLCASNITHQDNAKKNELSLSICKKFYDIQKNYKSSFIENFNNDLLQAHNAQSINLVIDSYSKIKKEVNIDLDLNMEKIKQQALNKRSFVNKV